MLVVVAALAASALPARGQDAPPSAEAPPQTSYTVKEGDTLYGIARRFGVSVRALQTWNTLDGAQITPGQTLRVRPPRSDEPSSDEPGAGDSAQQEPERTAKPATAEPSPDTGRVAARPPAPYGRYEAASGDTFVSLALRTGTTADSLFALNDSLTAPLAPGSVVRLPRRFGRPTHVVRRGDTLYGLAGRYGVSVRSLKAANNLTSDSLSPGQRLRLPGRPGSRPAEPGGLADPDTSGAVAVYPSTFAGRLTASGTAYDPEAFVGSHPTLPYGSLVLLTHPQTQRSTFARIIDRGPVEDDVMMDVSAAVAETLGVGDGGAAIELRVVWVDR